MYGIIIYCALCWYHLFWYLLTLIKIQEFCLKPWELHYSAITVSSDCCIDLLALGSRRRNCSNLESYQQAPVSDPNYIIVKANRSLKLALRSGLLDGQNITLCHICLIGTSALPGALSQALPPHIPSGHELTLISRVQNWLLISVVRKRITTVSGNRWFARLGRQGDQSWVTTAE